MKLLKKLFQKSSNDVSETLDHDEDMTVIWMMLTSFLQLLGYILTQINIMLAPLPVDMQSTIRMAIIGAPIGLLGIYCNRLYHRLSTLAYSQVQVKANSQVFSWITTCLSEEKQVIDKSQLLELRLSREEVNNKENPDDNSVVFELQDEGNYSSFYFTNKTGDRRQIFVCKSKMIMKDTPEYYYLILAKNEALWKFWRWGNSRYATTVIEEFTTFCKEVYDKKHNGKMDVYTWCGWGGFHFYWSKMSSFNKRCLKTVHLPEELIHDILSDCQQFLQDRDLYEKIGVPYRRGYLLYGAPGCGKSSFIKALASELNIPICILDLTGSQPLSDSGLQKLVNSAPQKSIILIEEVDTLFVSKEEKASENNNDQRRSGGDKPPNSGEIPTKNLAINATQNQLDELENLIDSIIAVDEDPIDDCLESIAVKIVNFLEGQNRRTNQDQEESSLEEPESPLSSTLPIVVQGQKTSIENDSPLILTEQWQQLFYILVSHGYNQDSCRFKKPLKDMKTICEQLPLGSLSVSFNLEQLDTLHETFQEVNIKKLYKELVDLKTSFRSISRLPVKRQNEETYLSKAQFREPSNKCICTFAGLLQAIDGVTAQEGRMVFFTTNHREKLDEALIRPGRMDRHIEFKPPTPECIEQQFVRFFQFAVKKVKNDGQEKEVVAIDRDELSNKARNFKDLIEGALTTHPNFKMPTLATTQVYFQTKFREPDPIQAALDGFSEFFQVSPNSSDLTIATGVDFQALTRQNSASYSPPKNETKSTTNDKLFKTSPL
jgi:SpoVK/Ycf46/Vps4 family AAA+-type ATPase